jgi:hypothetical protein
MIDWERFRNYPMGALEKTVSELLFKDYISSESNSAFEDKSSPEMETFFDVFMAGWKLAYISVNLDKPQ